MKNCLIPLLAVAFVTLSVHAQSKEQREAAKQWPLTLRITPGKNESKSHKNQDQKNSGRRTRTQVKTMEKTLHWVAKIDCHSTNFTEKVEIKAYHIGTDDGKFSILGTDRMPVRFDEKGRAEMEIASPTARLVKKTTRSGGRRGRITKEVTGDRVNGLVAQLLVNGTIVKTFVSQPAWAKGAWAADLSEDDLRPGGAKR